MEIPVLSRISGFEAEITRLQNPSLVSRVFQESIKVRTFCTWGALILALLATFSSLITRIKLLIFRLFKGRSVISQPLLQQLYYSDDDETDVEDEGYSSYDSSIQLSDDEDDVTYDTQRRFLFKGDFRVAGGCANFEEMKGQNGNFAFSWADFVNGGTSVVKSWEPALTVMPSPAVFMSAGFETGKNVALRVFDTRVGRQIPQIFAEWQQPYRELFDLDDVTDDVVVRDIRKITSPIEDVTESEMKTWFDTDAVIVDGNREILCSGKDCKSVVSRCRNAVFSYLF